MTTRPALIAVAGPTASGKSHLAWHLAQRFSGEILNCDSLQMYRYLDIGTAKPSRAERETVPHHFVDFLDPAEKFSAGEYARQARLVLTEVTARGRIPIVVGGAGFYLRALITGLFAGPTRHPELRARLRERESQKGVGYLYRLLRRLDPATASTMHPHDIPKLIRAIEVCLVTRERPSDLFRRGRQALEGYSVLALGLNPARKELYERINQRTTLFFQNGLVEEVSDLLMKGYPATAPALQSLGYRQALDYLLGRISYQDAIRHAQARTRQYAKRQMTWFRKEPDIHWIPGFGTDPPVRAEAERKISEHLLFIARN